MKIKTIAVPLVIIMVIIVSGYLFIQYQNSQQQERSLQNLTNKVYCLSAPNVGYDNLTMNHTTGKISFSFYHSSSPPQPNSTVYKNVKFICSHFFMKPTPENASYYSAPINNVSPFPAVVNVSGMPCFYPNLKIGGVYNGSLMVLYNWTAPNGTTFGGIAEMGCISVKAS